MSKTQMILLAGGKGDRFGGKLPKQFAQLKGKMVIVHTLERLEECRSIESVILVCNPEYIHIAEQCVERHKLYKVKHIIAGGETRQDSSRRGILAADEDTDYLLFHDAIRPFISEQIIDRVIEALKDNSAIDVAIPCADTIIEVDEEEKITGFPKRSRLRRGQTPQGFWKSLIMEAYRLYENDKDRPVFTDDCGIVAYYRLAGIRVVLGSELNLKITYQEDLELAEKMMS